MCASEEAADEVFSQKYRRYKWEAYCGTNRRRTAVQIGGVLQYKLEVYCGVSLSPKLGSQRGTALQMGGVLRYTWEVYRQYFSEKLHGLGVPKRSPEETFRRTFLQNPKVNILKTTPATNKKGSYHMSHMAQKSGFVCHESRSSYAIKVGSYTMFFCESRLISIKLYGIRPLI